MRGDSLGLLSVEGNLVELFRIAQDFLTYSGKYLYGN